jgi:hypothetical protein
MVVATQNRQQKAKLTNPSWCGGLNPKEPWSCLGHVRVDARPAHCGEHRGALPRCIKSAYKAMLLKALDGELVI